jgi:hypothetical protein
VDDAFDKAFLAHGREPQPTAKFLRHEIVRQALIDLGRLGLSFTVDEIGVKVEIPRFASSEEIDRVVAAVVAMVLAVRAVAAPLPGEDAVPEVRPARAERVMPTLTQRIRRANVNAIGKMDAQEATSLEPCTFDLVVETSKVWEGMRGPDGLEVLGTITGQGSRVAMHVPAEHAGERAGLVRGDRLTGECFLEAYEPLRDRAEVRTRHAPTRVGASPE